MSESRPSSKLIGLAYVMLGVGFGITGALELKNAFSAPDPVNGLLGRLGYANDSSDTLPGHAARTASAHLKGKMKTARTIEARVGYIKQLANKSSVSPRMKEIVAGILNRKCKAANGKDLKWCINEKDGKAEVIAIFNAVRDPNSPYAVRYMRDHVDIDQYTSPEKTWLLRGGDCDDQAAYVAALLKQAGFQVRLRICAARNQVNPATGERIPDDKAPWSHIYLVAGLPAGNPSKWFPLDTTMTYPPGWEAPNTMVSRRKDFPV